MPENNPDSLKKKLSHKGKLLFVDRFKYVLLEDKLYWLKTLSAILGSFILAHTMAALLPEVSRCNI